MDLILWRHAEAREAADGQSDAERPLSPKGERQAKRMAQWLNHHLPESTRVLVSPALRTLQTAEALHRKFRVVQGLEPGGSVESLLHAARWPDAKEPVLVIGHQPALGMTAAYLLCGATDPWLIRKGAIWWYRRRVRDANGSVVLQTVLAPDQV